MIQLDDLLDGDNDHLPVTKRKRPLTESDEVDDLIDHSIEIESNRRMRRSHMNLLTLTFKERINEEKVRRNATA